MQLAILIRTDGSVIVRYRTPKGGWHSDIREAQLLPLDEALVILQRLNNLTIPAGLLMWHPSMEEF